MKVLIWSSYSRHSLATITLFRQRFPHWSILVLMLRRHVFDVFLASLYVGINIFFFLLNFKLCFILILTFSSWYVLLYYWNIYVFCSPSTVNEVYIYITLSTRKLLLEQFVRFEDKDLKNKTIYARSVLFGVIVHNHGVHIMPFRNIHVEERPLHR